MNQQVLSGICAQVYQRFPVVAGVHPQVQERPDGQFLLVFRGAGKAADGRKIAQTIRVVAGPTGSITKMTASR